MHTFSLFDKEKPTYRGKWIQEKIEGNYMPTYGGGFAVIDLDIYLIGGLNQENTDTNTLQVFNTATKQLRKPFVKGELPIPRSYCTLSLVGKKLYLFGGYSKGTKAALNDLYVLDTEISFEWKLVQANGVAPTPRYEHVASVLKDRYICIFGGGSSRGWHNDIIIFDTVLREWKHIEPSGNKPTKRTSHTGIAYKNCIVTYGGYNAEKERIGDMHFLQMTSEEPLEFTWIQPKITKILPCGRAAAGVCLIDDSILICGGYSNKTERLNDLYSFSLKNLKYHPLDTGKNRPCERSYHIFANVGKRIYLLGGYDGQSVLENVWYLDIEFTSVPPIEIPKSTLSTTYKNLVNSSQYADVIFKLCDGSKIYGHRLILTSRNNYFKALLGKDMLEANLKEIDLSIDVEVERAPFIGLLEHIYSEDTEILEDNVVELFKMAHKYGDELLEAKCEGFIEERIDFSNVCDCLELSSAFHAPHLYNCCLNFIVSQFKFIYSKPSYQALPQELKAKVQELIEKNKEYY